MKHSINLLTIISFVTLLYSCGTGTREADGLDSEKLNEDRDNYAEDTTHQITAEAHISSASNSEVSGRVKFIQKSDHTVLIHVALDHIPAGEHALHLHEKGDCSASDATSAGGHWNPTDKQHGKRGSDEFHTGDIINLKVNESRKVSWSEIVKGWTIGGSDSTNILNKAVIIHSGVDDFTSQPSGSAGSRIGCGVVTLVN